MPLFNDEDTVGAALESVLAQTLRSVEVICVDDASTDDTMGVVQKFVAQDPRVRLIRHDHNRSAFQARRTGVFAARAEFAMFVDGDDELVPGAAEAALALVRAAGADIGGFGVTVIEKDGRTGGDYERRLEHAHPSLDGANVLDGLFPIGRPAQGQLWRYIFQTRLLQRAYSLLSEELKLPRVNDLPLMFLVAALSTRFVSSTEKLYRYYFGRGGSGQMVESIERAEFYASAIRSIDSIRGPVYDLAAARAEPASLTDAYESARLSIVGYVCAQLLEHSNRLVVDDAIAHIHTIAPAQDVIRGVAKFYPRALAKLKYHTPWQPLNRGTMRNVLLVTSLLRTGGVSSVIAAQAEYLREAGYDVIVVARSRGSDMAAMPAGVKFVEMAQHDRSARFEEWAAICRDNRIDVVIDHEVLYTQEWPEFSLLARAEGASTIGWLHNFVGRPIYDGTDQLSLIEESSNTLSQIIALSPLDVAYFKFRGISHVAYVPNPPSPIVRDALPTPRVRHAPLARIKLVWWGRLDQHTKRVTDLIAVGVHLRERGIDFTLTVIGPDWDDMTAKKFTRKARRHGLADRVVAVGPLKGSDLIQAIDDADAFISTSIIEGYQLTIAEAQARGLPVFMYRLPWLTLIEGNRGIVSVSQRDAPGLADQIAEVVRDPARYYALSLAATEAAKANRALDFGRLYVDVINGTLPGKYSPQPTLEDAGELLGLFRFFAEHRSKPGSAPGRRAMSEEPTRGARVWFIAAPMGRRVLHRFPSLRPLARRAKSMLKAER